MARFMIRDETVECPICSEQFNPTKDFRNADSQKEFTISGMCQSCQDSVFGED